MLRPADIQLIAGQLCIRWQDSSESFLAGSFLRQQSPSAQNIGERDILGVLHGQDRRGEDFSSVELTGFQYVGNYALQLSFSDGHSSGIYSWDYLKSLEK